MGCTCWQSPASYHLYSVRLGIACLTKATYQDIQGQCVLKQSSVRSESIFAETSSLSTARLIKGVPHQYLIYTSHQTIIAGGLAACYMNLSSRLKLKMLSYTTVRWACAFIQARNSTSDQLS